ncbi:Cation/H+ exchanger [Macleaya cordata]|uniref:Cation/H+ exchanger n=1 Tax=Macleaya cordata TaxID=56857 RepID=A0A200R9R4_MACCD|nr:Cation/H+ exchanger [Macleaya cordata]
MKFVWRSKKKKKIISIERKLKEYHAAVEEMNVTMESLAAVAAAEAMMNATRSNTKKNGTSVQVGCEYASANTYAAGSFFVVLSLSLSCKFLHIALFQRFFRQPRISSELIVGLIIGNLPQLYTFLDMLIPKFNSFAEMGMSCYLLVLGLEMDPSVLFKKPTPELIIAYIGVLASFVIGSIGTPLLKLGIPDTVGFILTLSLALAGNSSQVLTRIVTNLNISKTDIGKLVIGAGMHTDMITMILISVALAFHPTQTKQYITLVEGGFIIFIMTTEIIILLKLFPVFVNWITNRNPEGKKMRGSDLIIFVGTLFFLCSTGPMIVGYSPTMTSFLVGLAFPRKGRITKMVVSKINQMTSFVYFPIFFCWAGALASFKPLRLLDTDKFIGIKLFSLYVLVMIGKLSGTLLSGMVLGFDWPIAIAIALFLNVKGYFHIFVAAFALEEGYLSNGSYIVLIFFAILSIVPVPWLVKSVVERAQKQSSTYKRMAIQWVDPNSELRMLLCIHGPQNVPSMINIMEVSRGNTDPRIGVYVTDMIEINDCNSTMFIPDHQDHHCSPDVDGVKMADESVVDMREHITNAILSYVEKSGEGINVHRLLAISTFANMHQDLYNLAEAVQASLLILPYHRNQKNDGKMDNVHHGFRHVNRKVLRQPPCSVGILVDRGLGSINKGSGSSSSAMMTLHVAVVFIGGKDDREALAYAARISQHPGIKLTAIRFLQDNNAEKASSRAKKPPSIRAMEEQELRLDDEYFAEFYQKKVAHGKVGYVEKHVVNAKETVSTLKALEGQYALFIVGRAGRINCILTAGMNAWEECPDLGPIGEILADSDFSTTASVLVIQQHYVEELENEFRVMS